MTCQEFWNSMPELAGESAPECRAHARQCAPCAALLGGHQAVAAGLRSVAAEWNRVKAPGRVEGRLLAEFRGQAGLAVPAPARRWWLPVATWLAAAAVVAAAVLLFVVRERKLQPPQPPLGSAEMAAADWAAGLPLDEETAGVEDEYIPVPDADRLPPSGDVNVVRVEVPRSAMLAMGFAVNPERAAELVRADVVLGSDGLARAVRFLDE